MNIQGLRSEIRKKGEKYEYTKIKKHLHQVSSSFVSPFFWSTRINDFL